MDLATEFESPDFGNYKCYKMGGILHVPHYTKPGVYVAPCIKIVNQFGRNAVSYTHLTLPTKRIV